MKIMINYHMHVKGACIGHHDPALSALHTPIDSRDPRRKPAQMSTTLPGLRMLSGSRLRLSSRIISTVFSPY